MMDAGLGERLASVHPVVEKICNVSGVLGLSLGVSQRGQVVHRFKYGSSDLDGAAVSTYSDIIHGIESMTKNFTATAIAKLVAHLLRKNQILQTYAELLRPTLGTGPFRAQSDYSNRHYAVCTEEWK